MYYMLTKDHTLWKCGSLVKGLIFHPRGVQFKFSYLGANEIQWANMITIEKDFMFFFFQFFFHMNEFWNNFSNNLL
jgi:hypothetical protein